MRYASVLIASLVLLPGLATAQESAEESRAFFESAGVAIQEGRFAEARELLRRSLALQPGRAAAFNLGVALRGTGESRASIAVFRELLSGEYGELDAARREQVNALLTEVREDLASLRVSACGADSVEVRVDGELRSTLTRCAEDSVEVDAGTHVVRFDAERADPIEHRVAVEPGGTETVEALMESRPEEASEDVAASPWLWLGLTAGVLGATALVVLIVLTVDPLNEPHVVDDVYGEIIALRFD